MSDNFAPDYIASLTAYSSAKSEKLSGSTWLNANESPFTNEFELNLTNLNRYPDPQPEAVISAYASYADLAPSNVLMTRGADEGIELLVSTFCRSGVDAIAQFIPTYGMYKVTAESANVTLINLTQSDLLEASTTELVEKALNAKLVFICNPNNPTGSVVPLKRIEEIAYAFKDKAIVVVDEAYIEFCDELTAAQLIKSHQNVVVLRTLSKAFALAGLRTGFVLSNQTLINTMRKVLAPYPVSTVVASIAEQALSPCNINSMKRQVTILNNNRETLISTLKQCIKVVKILPSFANFVTIKLSDKCYITKAMASGLIMRPFTLYGEDDWLRISIGSEQELNVVFNWLMEING
ncbi:histidinol-phosphate transaminase [Pseudoalteromonas sp.]|uniref:histidinol-phosphate transaminase n=1 Tax=Pseudoalteromonas sp. TaxID=53249 RepID=UPI003566BABF